MLLRIFKVSGHSMQPTLYYHDKVFVSNIPYLFREPKSGDMIAYYDSESKKTFIKRIKDIKNEQYYVIGDNSNDSRDSRQLGWVKRNAIIGKVIYIHKSKFKDQKSKV